MRNGHTGYRKEEEMDNLAQEYEMPEASTSSSLPQSDTVDDIQGDSN